MEEKKVVLPRALGLKVVIVFVLVFIVSAFLFHNIGYWEGHADGYKVGQFAFYYVKPSEQKYGVHDLAEELRGLEWIHPYQEDVFDCSEMSAYLEWYLENEGWHTFIVVGNSLFDSGRHAWLLVETSPNSYMPVETTNIQVVWGDNPYFDNYFNYDHKFEKIQDALEYDPSGFDWWEK